MTFPESPDPRPPSSGRRVSLLDSLLADPLDPGYAEAARRRSAEPPTGGARRRDQALLATGCALIGLILVVAYLHADRAAPSDARTRADLRGRIASAERDGDELDRRVQALAARLDVVRRNALGPGADPGALARAEASAATTAVRGPGVQITLGNPAPATSPAGSDSPGRNPVGPSTVLTDVDVRAVVNELWRDGAEAIAVNHIRLTPTSAIRFAGQAVLVDFRPITSPYRIEAIGDPDRLITGFTDSGVASRLRTLASADGLVFDSGQVDRLTLSASVPAVPRYARRTS